MRKLISPVEDSRKLEAEGAVRHIVIRGGDASVLQVRPTVAHLGMLWGQALEVGMTHERATELIVDVANDWAASGNARPNQVLHIGDDDVLDGIYRDHVVSIIPDSDWGGLFDFGVQYGQRRQLGQTHAQALFETGAWLSQWYGVENPWQWQAPPRPVHPDPLPGQIGLNNGAFTCATGPRNIAAVHLGNMIGHGLIHGVDTILPVLDLVASLGYHEMRSWFQLKTNPGGWWDKWSTPRWNPTDSPQRFLEILAAGAERGLKWHLAGGGIKDMSNGEEEACFGLLNQAIRQIGPEAFSLIEAANEVRDTGDEDDIDPRELTRLVDIATAGFPQILTALSAYTGTEDREVLKHYTPSRMKFYIIHSFRGGRVHDKLRHLYSLSGEDVPVRRNAKHSEPYGPGRLVSASSGSEELNGHTMAMSAAMCAVARGAWTFMSGPGVILEDEPLYTMPGLAETPNILRALPQDLAQFQILGHGGARLRGQRIWAALDDWRADYAIHHDGRFVAINYGPPEQHSADHLQKERATSAEEIIEDGPWGRVIVGRL